MPTGLKRYQTQGHDHLITFSCYHRQPYLDDNNAKSTFEHIFEETRSKYRFGIHAYVVMPEHVHLLVSEPDVTRLATAINVLKFRTSKHLKGASKQFWQTRYHDANILTHRRWLNALRYIHHNPVTRGPALDPEDWPWSSYRHWLTGESGRVEIESHGTWSRREAGHSAPVYANRRFTTPATPSSPVPSSAMLDGSGVTLDALPATTDPEGYRMPPAIVSSSYEKLLEIVPPEADSPDVK